MKLVEIRRDSFHDELENCMFCDEPLDDPGLGFLEHVEENPTCQSRYEDWKVNLDDDWRGG